MKFLDLGQVIGLSAYQLAVKQGYKGSLDEWLAHLKYDHSEEYQGFKRDVEAAVSKFTSQKAELDSKMESISQLVTQALQEIGNKKAAYINELASKRDVVLSEISSSKEEAQAKIEEDLANAIKAMNANGDAWESRVNSVGKLTKEEVKNAADVTLSAFKKAVEDKTVEELEKINTDAIVQQVTEQSNKILEQEKTLDNHENRIQTLEDEPKVPENLVKELEETKRNLDFLYKLNRGISYDFETKEQESYSNDVPSGAKLMDLKRIGGKSLVWSQLNPNNNFRDLDSIRSITGIMGTLTVENNILSLKSESVNGSHGINIFAPFKAKHTYMAVCDIMPIGVTNIARLNYDNFATTESVELINDVWTHVKLSTTFYENETRIYLYLMLKAAYVGTEVKVKNLKIFDITIDGINKDNVDVIAYKDYYPYQEPTLLNAEVESVDVVGKNLVEKIIANSNINDKGIISPFSDGDIAVAMVKKNEEYIIKTNDISGLVLGFYSEYPKMGDISYDNTRHIDNKKRTFISPIDGYACFRTLPNFSEAQLEKGSVETPYTPYREPQSLPIKSLISKYFPNGMKSAGSIYDEIDFENKVAIQRVGSVDLGSLNYNYVNTTGDIFGFRSTKLPEGISPTKGSMYVNNLLCSKYKTVSWETGFNGANLCIAQLSVAIHINDKLYTDVSQFKQAMQGVILYYELAEPIITPITEDLSMFEDVEVESGGSVTFMQTYKHIQILNKEEYLISLKEVNANV